MKKLFEEHTKKLEEGIKGVGPFHDQVLEVTDRLKKLFDDGKKILIAGNGGSGEQALHLSDELVGRYKNDRKAYPAIALTSDGAVLTCIGNDFGYENVFARQVEALGEKGDMFIGLTTSGNSENILKAAEVAKSEEMTVVAMCGPGGKFREVADMIIEAPTDKASIMQEFHLHAIHLICEAFEEPLTIES